MSGCRTLCAFLIGAFLILSGCSTPEYHFGTPETEQQRELREFAKLLERAKAGDDEAQYRLARAYERGDGAPRDLAKAHQWYLAAAQSGHVRAMRPLGDLYFDGEGTPRNISRARFWYQRAFDNDDVAAGYRLAMMDLEPEEGRERNVARGLDFLERSARGGYVPAQLDLAEIHERGDIVPANPSEARRWYGIAQTELQSEAEDDDATSLQRLGDVFRDGRGVPANGLKAAEYYQKAADLGRTSALMRLGRLYDRGAANLSADPAQAASYYHLADEAGNRGAPYALAKKYASGVGVPLDGKKAFQLYEKALRFGEDRAYYGLGELLSDPGVEPTNYGAAIEWLERGARAGHAKSMFRIAEILAENAPRPSSAAEILSWYMLAQDHGYSRAGRKIDEMWSVTDPGTRDEARALANAFEVTSSGA